MSVNHYESTKEKLFAFCLATDLFIPVEPWWAKDCRYTSARDSVLGVSHQLGPCELRSPSFVFNWPSRWFHFTVLSFLYLGQNRLKIVFVQNKLYVSVVWYFIYKFVSCEFYPNDIIITWFAFYIKPKSRLAAKKETSISSFNVKL